MNQDNVDIVRAFYENSYQTLGFKAQRKYPNEELCRFMGRNFFGIDDFNIRKNTRILETGCGSGANLWMIAREGFDAYGIDLSQHSLDLCEKMLQNYGVSATLEEQNMTELSFEEHYFDAVVDVFSSYCLTQIESFKYLQGVNRVLKKDGLFFSYFPSKNSMSFKEPGEARLLDADTLNSIVRKDAAFTGQLYPFRFLYPQEYKKQLEDAGFRVQYTETVNRTYHNQKELFEFVVIEAIKI